MIAQNVRPVRESGGASPRRQRIGSYPTSSNMDSNSTVSRSSSAEPRSQIGKNCTKFPLRGGGAVSVLV